jgi:hypothetical protein
MMFSLLLTKPTYGAMEDICFYISEVHPAPKDIDLNKDGQSNSEDEFIEIYNCASNSIDLSNYRIDDIRSGGSNEYLLNSVQIEAGHSIVLWNTETNIALNNSNDEVNLISPAGEVISRYTYNNTTYDQSFQYIDSWNTWITGAPTPNENNISVELKNISDLKKNTLSSIQGFIVEDGNILEQDYAILQDRTGAIEISNEAIDLKANQSYHILGEVNQENFIPIASQPINLESINWPTLEVGDISQNDINSKICVEGFVSEILEDYIIVSSEEENNSIRIYTTPSQTMDNKLLKACGILDRKYNTYRIYPTTDKDLQWVENVKNYETADTGKPFIIAPIIITFTFLFNVIYLLRNKFIKH